MAPPREACECFCLHCRRVFMSDRMWFQKVINARDGFEGFWMCPTNNCSGAGFTFDIFPTDPDHPANEGWHDCSEFEDEEEEEPGAEREWDPEESKYAQMDAGYAADGDDDLEGEEWKHGLKPGEEPAETEEMKKARMQWEAEQRKYDEPDERPRVLDWKDKDDRTVGDWGEDAIPF